MKKGNFGIPLCLYTILAFIMTYFGQAVVLFLIAGAVIFLERNEWAGRQVIQAICLYLVRTIINLVLGLINSIFEFSFALFTGIPQIGNMGSLANAIINLAVTAFMLIFCFVGIINNLKGEDANIIGAAQLADWVYGKVNVSEDAKE